MSIVVFLLDGSGSMESACGKTTRYDWGLQRIGELIASLQEKDTIAIEVFSDTISDIMFTTKQDAVIKCNGLVGVSSIGGATRLFDSAALAADQLDNYLPSDQQERKLIVITDDEDTNSSKFVSWGALDTFLASLTHSIVLQVIAVPGANLIKTQTQSNPTAATQILPVSPSAPISKGERIELYSDISALFADKSFTEAKSHHISFPLINCDTDLDGKAVSMIREQYYSIIPYLEKLTGLRYYPVPTVIIPESEIEKLVSIPLDPLTPIINMLQHLALTYFYADLKISDNTIVLRGRLDPDSFNEFVCQIKEGLLTVMIESYLRYGTWDIDVWLTNRLKEWGIELPDDIIRVLIMIRDDWNEIAKQGPKEKIESHQQCFGIDEKSLLTIKELTGCPINIAQWEWVKPYENSTDVFFRNCRDYVYSHTTAEQCALVFSFIAEWLINAIRQKNKNISALPTQSQRDWRKKYFIEKVRRYGFYRQCNNMPLSEVNLPQTITELNKTSGIVFVCAKPIFDTVGKVVQETIGEDTIASKDKVVNICFDEKHASNMFACVLLHEHFHAIMQEGIPSRDANPNHDQKALEEGMAEWAEIDYFRSDSEMKEWCINHASSGPFPIWPYAGALFIEAMTEGASAAVRRIIKHYRKNPEKEFNAFMKRLGQKTKI